MKEAVLKYAEEHYNTRPEYLWKKRYPDDAVLRRSDNKKWYALIMNVSREKLGLSGNGRIDILNVKADVIMLGSLRKKNGILPGYHMNKENWISILLDGTVSLDDILALLDLSYNLVSGSKNP